LLLHDDSARAVELREESFVLGVYDRTRFHPRSGKGARLFDADGRAYWDLLSGIGVSALGHSHPAILRAMREAVREPLHISNLHYHPWQGLLAERLASASGLDRTFFCNSGTEANEAALKFARLRNPGRTRIVAVEGSFHGRTFGSLSVTGNEKYRSPFVPLIDADVVFVAPNDLPALERAITESTSAVIVEPVMGEGGVIPLSPQFMQRASVLSDRVGAVLICDEIQCGLGRTGSLFAYERSGIIPDIVTLAKPLGGGLPLGAVVTSSRIAEVVRPGHHGTTFGGNPVACRLGLAFLQTIAIDRLLQRVETLGVWIEEAFAPLLGRGVVEIRGAGLMWGVELNRPASSVVQALFERGFIVGTAGERVVRLLPPYVVPERALRDFVRNLEIILKEKNQ
jgi:acetylornithine/N-succinyldiaminopimelate aminotransferase